MPILAQIVYFGVIQVKSRVPSVASPFYRVIDSYLASLDIDCRALLQELNIPEEATDEPSNRIPLATYMRLLERAAILANDPHIGLHVYEKKNISEFGLFGYALLTAPTLRDAMLVSSNHQHAIQDRTELSLSMQGDRFTMAYEVDYGDIPYCRHDSEIAIMFGLRLMRVLIGESWSPSEVHFQHAMVGDGAAYRDAIRAPVLFEQSCNRAIFDSAELDRSMPMADDGLFEILRGDLQRVIDDISVGSSLATDIKQAIRKELETGLPGIDDIANRLAVSRRTLQRRLADESLSFTDILEDTLEKMALHYLEATEFSLIDIALLLGYSDMSSFGRAFKRWRNCTPTQHRRSYRNVMQRIL